MGFRAKENLLLFQADICYLDNQECIILPLFASVSLIPFMEGYIILFLLQSLNEVRSVHSKKL
jgi:hypothetical protein